MSSNPFYSVGTNLICTDGTMLKRVVQLTDEQLVIGNKLDCKSDITVHEDVQVSGSLITNKLKLTSSSVSNLKVSAQNIQFPDTQSFGRLAPLQNLQVTNNGTTVFKIVRKETVDISTENVMFTGDDIQINASELLFTGNTTTPDRNYVTIQGQVDPAVMYDLSSLGSIWCLYGEVLSSSTRFVDAYTRLEYDSTRGGYSARGSAFFNLYHAALFNDDSSYVQVSKGSAVNTNNVFMTITPITSLTQYDELKNVVFWAFKYN